MKFVENDYEKVERLLELREKAKGALGSVEREIENEMKVCFLSNTSPKWRFTLPCLVYFIRPPIFDFGMGRQSQMLI